MSLRGAKCVASISMLLDSKHAGKHMELIQGAHQKV